MNVFEPLRITAWLQCGVVTDATLPIDSIIYYQVYRDAYGHQDMTLPGGDSSGIGEAYMPFARRNLPYDGFRYVDGAPLWRGCGDELKITVKEQPWYYAASFAQWGPHIDGTDHWNKRFDASLADLIDFGSKRGKVIVEQGAYKAYHMPVFYRHALTITWYVVGDGDVIERLLRQTTHIGKKYAQGWGAVLRWQVDSWEHDWSVWGPDGQLMRAIPDDKGILTGIRPSYWLPRNQVRCLMPG